MSDKQLLKPVSVRFPRGLKDRLVVVSKKFRIKECEVVRRALEHKLPEWESGQQLVIHASKETSR